MSKNKSKDAKISFKVGASDERIPKLGGVLCLFLAFYLFIAFVSYLFTWQEDQSDVMEFSWSLLLHKEVEMANWLGRLGAILSHQFFYWWFGLPSFLFVFALLVVGLAFIFRAPLARFWKPLRTSFWVLILSSIFLEFVFGSAAFPWGGAFGEAIVLWLTKFLGTLGVILLFAFMVGALLVYSFNPNFEDMSWEQIVQQTKNGLLDFLGGGWKKTRPEFMDDFTSKPKATANTPLAPTVQRVEHGGQLAFDIVQEEAIKPAITENEVNPNLELQYLGEDKIFDKPSLEQGDVTSLIPETDIAQGDGLPMEPYDPTLELGKYQYPSLDLLENYDEQKIEIDRAELESNKDQIIETLLNYKIEITKIMATIGPTVTLYEIVPAPGVRISRIKNLEDDIALSLSALGIRIIAPIPGRGTIGIEVPNKKKQIVALKELLHSDKFKNAGMDLPIALGKTISNEVFVADLAKMPHLLIAGATGQGKSVGINTLLMSLLYKKHPSEVKLVMVDPKKVELFPYSKLENHFLGFLPGAEEPITTETHRVVHTLNSLCIEMDQRYDLLKKANVRNIKEYNEKFQQRRLNPEKGHNHLPFIVLIIDEFADLIMTAGKEIELPIGRLAQLARAVGIHLVIATQRPSVNIITGVIKANFPVRIAYKVASKIDSRTILDAGGAEQLIGRGDMLLSIGSNVIRLQCGFVDTPEVERVIDFIGDQQGYPQPFFLPEFHGDDEIQGSTSLKASDMDEMLEDAARMVVQSQQGSTSMLQRKFKLGYNRAGRIMDQLEALGIVGPSDGSKAREVLFVDETEVIRFLEKFKNKS